MLIDGHCCFCSHQPIVFVVKTRSAYNDIKMCIRDRHNPLPTHRFEKSSCIQSHPNRKAINLRKLPLPTASYKFACFSLPASQCDNSIDVFDVLPHLPSAAYQSSTDLLSLHQLSFFHIAAIPVSYTHLDVYKRQAFTVLCLMELSKSCRVEEAILPVRSLRTS